MPREGEQAGRAYAGDLADRDPPTCSLADPASAVQGRLDGTRYGYAVALSEEGVVLGRVRRSDLSSVPGNAIAEGLMEAGPSTVRFNKPVDELVERLRRENLETMIVTTPAGCLIGVFHREDGERLLRDGAGGG